jgi:tripartite-type tricarboxylate transporter receptor subunit TctC
MKRICLLALLAMIAWAATPALAQNYPTRGVRIVIPFDPGGGSDLHARTLANELGKVWKTPLIAAGAVARSKPDGYTIFFATHPIMAINPALYEKLNYDPEADFIPVIKLGETALMALVSANSGINTIADLIKLAKDKPGTLNFGSGGMGTTQHLSAELFKAAAGIDIVHVPFKGGAPANMAMMAGQIHLQFDSFFPGMVLMRAGKIRGIAVTGKKRQAQLPDMPTVGETLKGYESVLGYGILVPAGTPAPIVTALNRDINKVLADPAYKKEMTDRGIDLDGGTPEEFKAWLGVERKKWSDLIKRMGIKAG